MNKLNDIYNWIDAHKLPISIAAGWFIHMGLPRLQAYCESRDGGIVPKIFFALFGKPKTISPDKLAEEKQTK
jgi:hypothetical protein